MRALIIADIHSNLEALLGVIGDARDRGGFDEIWCLGDIVGYGPNPIECIEILRHHNTTCVAGNHDLAVIGQISTATFNENAAKSAAWTVQQLSAQDISFLSALPQVERIGAFTLVHGSLRDPTWEYLVSNSAATATFHILRTRICLVGHSHLPFLLREGGVFTPVEENITISLLSPDNTTRMIINPGGAGQPRDGNPRTSYVIYDESAATLGWHRVAYDFTITQGKMSAARLPERLIDRLDTGR